MPVTGIILLVAIFAYAGRSGTWLDEYWQLWFSGAEDGQAIWQKLWRDTHPPWFSLFARGLFELAGPGVIVPRLVSSALSIAFITAALAALAKASTSTEVRSAYAWFWLLAIAICGPFGLIEIAASFRSYTWIFAFGTVQVATLYALISGQKGWTTVSLGAIATFGAITLHYANGITAVAIAFSTTTIAWRKNARGPAVAIAAAAAIAVASNLVFATLQRKHWAGFFDYNWLAPSTQPGVTAFGPVLAVFFAFNLATVVLVLWPIAERRVRREDLWLLAPLPIAVAALLAVHTFTPVNLPRYLLVLPLLLAMFAAGLLARARLRRADVAIVCAVLLAQLSFHVWQRPPIAGWEGNGSKIAAIVRRCPSTKVFAASHWLLSDGRGSRMAQYESGISRLAYDRVSSRAGFKATFLNGDNATQAVPGNCPVVLWLEHAAELQRLNPDRVFEQVGLNLPARASIQRVVGENGSIFVVRK